MQVAGDMVDIMFSIMRNKRASTRVVELAAQVIAADARFNGKVGNAKAKSQSGEWIFRAIDFAGQMLKECEELNDKFAAGALDTGTVCDALEEARIKIEGFVVS